MLLAGLFTIGAGLVVLLLSQLYNAKPPAGFKRSRAIILSVDSRGTQQHVKGQYYQGIESKAFSTTYSGSGTFFPGQQIFVDYNANDTAVPVQLRSIQEVMGKKFLWLLIGGLLVTAGVVLVRAAGR